MCGWGTARSRRDRLTASVLLAGLLLLSFGPTCGSTLDVDPARCCERHSCQGTGGTCQKNPKNAKGAKDHAPCPGPTKTSDSGSNPEQCCDRGQLTHPIANVQPEAGALLLAVSVALATVPRLGISSATSRRPVYTRSALKIPSSPLYDLNSTYRI